MKKKFLAVLLVLCAVVLFALPAYAASDTSVGYTVNVTLSADSYFCGTEGHTGEVTSISIKNVDSSEWDTSETRPLTVLFEVSFKCSTCGVSGTKIANNALSLTFRDADSCHAPFNASVTARKLLTGRDDSITFTLTRDKIGYAEKIDKKDATCTESGISQTCWECQGCKQIFSDENCTNKLANDISGVTIPASGHSLTRYEAQDANCQHDGWVEHWRCGKCNGYFLDATGLNPTGSSSVMRYDRNKHVGDTVYVPYNLEGKRNHKVYPSCHPDIFTTEPHVLGDSSKGEDPDYCALCGQIVAAKVLHSVDPYEKRFFAHDDAIADFNSSETSEEIHFLRSFDRTVSINKAGTVRLAEGKYITYMNVGDYDVTIWNDGKITNLNAYSSTTLRGSKTGTYGKITNRTEGGTVGDLLFRVNSNSAYYVTEDLQWISRAAASGSSISEVRVLYSPFTYIEITGDGVKAATDEADKYKLTALRGETVILDVATYSIQPAMNFPGSDSSITWDYGGIPDDHVHVDRNVDWKDLRLTITDLPSGTYTLTFTRTAVNKFSVSATLVLTVEETLTAHTVTFDPNGGTLSEGEMSSKSVFPGDAYGALPTPTRVNYRFDGWFTEKDGGTKVEETTIMSSRAAHTLYAHWTPIHVHAYTQQVQKPEALKTPADCTNNAVYYLSCACGEVSTNDADTFTAANTALDHDWGAWTQNSDEKTHTRICKRDTSHTETENCHGGTATCTQRATCTVCGAEYGDALGHDFTTSWTHDDNEHWKQCSRCDAKDDVSPHTWDSGTITTAPTCTKAGKKTYSCTKCDATKIEPIPATGHSWKSDWTSDATHHWYECDNKNCDVTDNAGKKGYAEHSGGKATCTQNAVCEFCKAEYGEKLPHDFTAETVDAKYLKSAATCTEKAVYYKSCAVCGLSSEGTADEATFFSGNVLDHDWGAWTQNSDEKTHTRICKRDTSHTETENCHGGTATCTAKAVCTVCGGEYGEMAAHSFTAEKAETQYLKSAATCTQKAVYYKSCAVCGLSSEGTADEATFFSGNVLDHDWGAWTQNSDEKTHTRICKRDTSHTETENCIDANKDHKCDICDYIISECADDNKDHKCDYCGKKLTEHTGGKATCKDKAKCEVCGAEYGELDAKNHTDLKHFPATAANKTTEGNIEYWYCEGCGKYYSDKDGTKEIKKADTVTAKLKDDSKSPQTGDTSNLALWIALLFVSGGAAIGTTVVSRKKKYNR